TREFIDHYFTSQDLKILPDIEASNMDFLIECAKIGLGITSALREFIVKDLENENLIEIPIKVPIPSRNIGVIYKKGSTPSIAAEALIHYLQNTKERNF
ncbi:MAG: LysR family transcriptional regulator substrate-binding protein, partial [Clostridium sp.]